MTTTYDVCEDFQASGGSERVLLEVKMLFMG
jgi:hypothetical protein